MTLIALMTPISQKPSAVRRGPRPAAGFGLNALFWYGCVRTMTLCDGKNAIIAV